LEILREYLGGCGDILERLLGGLRGEIYWYAFELTYERFHGVLGEFSRGLRRVLFKFGVGFGGVF
jgi:hypothetical protein